MRERPRARRLTPTEARTQLSSILDEFRAITEPNYSIGDRAVLIGCNEEDLGALLPPADFEHALEREELLEDLLLELAVSKRIAARPGRTYSLEEVARELGLADELGR